MGCTHSTARPSNLKWKDGAQQIRKSKISPPMLQVLPPNSLTSIYSYDDFISASSAGTTNAGQVNGIPMRPSLPAYSSTYTAATSISTSSTGNEKTGPLKRNPLPASIPSYTSTHNASNSHSTHTTDTEYTARLQKITLPPSQPSYTPSHTTNSSLSAFSTSTQSTSNTRTKGVEHKPSQPNLSRRGTAEKAIVSILEIGLPQPLDLNFTTSACKSEAEETNREEEMLAVGVLIGELVHAIRALSFGMGQVRTQTLDDISGVGDAMHHSSEASTIWEKLRTLYEEVAGLYAEKKKVLDCSCGSVLGELEGLWGEFEGLDEGVQRVMANELRKGSGLMRIFDILSALRAGCEELLSLSQRISSRLSKDFDMILAELKGLEDAEGGGDGQTERGGAGGKGEGLRGTASMKWRVLDIVVEKRAEHSEEKVKAVKSIRGLVSLAVLGVVEGLVEGG